MHIFDKIYFVFGLSIKLIENAPEEIDDNIFPYKDMFLIDK
jgi:hypothetical protein